MCVFGFQCLARFVSCLGGGIKKEMKEEKVKGLGGGKEGGESGRVYLALMSLKRQLRFDDLVKDRKKGRVAREVSDAYRSCL